MNRYCDGVSQAWCLCSRILLRVEKTDRQTSSFCELICWLMCIAELIREIRVPVLPIPALQWISIFSFLWKSSYWWFFSTKSAANYIIRLSWLKMESTLKLSMMLGVPKSAHFKKCICSMFLSSIGSSSCLVEILSCREIMWGWWAVFMS